MCYNYFHHLTGLASNASSIISFFNDLQPPNDFFGMITASPYSLQMVAESTPNENPSDENKSVKKTLSMDSFVKLVNSLQTEKRRKKSLR